MWRRVVWDPGSLQRAAPPLVPCWDLGRLHHHYWIGITSGRHRVGIVCPEARSQPTMVCRMPPRSVRRRHSHAVRVGTATEPGPPIHRAQSMHHTDRRPAATVSRCGSGDAAGGRRVRSGCERIPTPPGQVRSMCGWWSGQGRSARHTCQRCELWDRSVLQSGQVTLRAGQD